MNILALNKSIIFDEESYGGAEVRLHNILSRWGKYCNHSVSLIVPSFPKNHKSELLTSYKIIRVGFESSRKFLSPFWLDVGTIFNICKEKPDAIYLGSTPFPISASIFSRLPLKSKVVAHIDHLPDSSELSSSRSRFTNFLYKLNKTLIELLPRQLTITTVSQATRSQLFRMGFKNVRVIPNGVDHTLFKPLNVEEEPLTIFSWGLFYKRKGFHILLAAMRKISRKYPSVRLDIAGSGPELLFLRSMAKSLDINEKVRFLGRINDEELVFRLCKASIVCVPSLSEGFGMPILEAMSCKRPIIVSDIDAFRELVTDNLNGILFRKGNSDSLAEKIITLLEDGELRKRIAQKGYKYSLKFDWAEIAQRELSVLEG